jgi:hypothetical protein
MNSRFLGDEAARARGFIGGISRACDSRAIMARVKYRKEREKEREREMILKKTKPQSIFNIYIYVYIYIYIYIYIYSKAMAEEKKDIIKRKKHKR